MRKMRFVTHILKCLVVTTTASLLERQLPGEHWSFKGRSKDLVWANIGQLPPDDAGLGDQPAVILGSGWLAGTTRAWHRLDTDYGPSHIKVLVSNMRRNNFTVKTITFEHATQLHTVSYSRKRPGTSYKCGALGGRRAWVGEDPASFLVICVYHETLHQT